MVDEPAVTERKSAGLPTQRSRQGEPRHPVVRPGWATWSLPGAWVALAFACLSFTPSLLPRSGPLQGAIAGVTAAIGYGVGVLGAAVWREFADRDAREPSRRAWLVLGIVAVVALVVSAALGQRWQGRLRELMGMEPAGWTLLLVPLVAAAVFLLLVGTGRGLRAVSRWVAKLLSRWFGERAARATGVITVAAVTWLLVSGVLLDGLVRAADNSFAVANEITPDGVEQPDSVLRSGSPASLVPWDSLGREGRKFTATGPSADDIAAFAGPPAVEPVRVFAGLESADTVEERAALAVRELDRTGGFDRGYLMVATTTGSGWLEPSSVDSFEYMTGGDSAIVSLQYSYLPSWISYLVDQARAREAGRELFDAVYERWLQLPVGERPRLLVFGESLGSFGGETAFSGSHDMANRTDGVLFAGPPRFNTLSGEFTEDREPGTPEIEPVFRDGRIVRYTARPADDPDISDPAWERTRVLYLLHPSDPIVWWSPDLLFERPDWLSEPAGSDVLEEMLWLPVVTFWQVTADLPGATTVPPGHGHMYRGQHVDGWAAVLQPQGWTEERAEALRSIVLDAG